MNKKKTPKKSTLTFTLFFLSLPPLLILVGISGFLTWGCDDEVNVADLPSESMQMMGGQNSGSLTGGDLSTGGEMSTETQGGEEDLLSPLPSDWTDPQCLDGQYQEILPDFNVEISDLITNYNSSDPASFVFAVLERRYPMGKLLVEEGRMGPFGDCIEVFLRDRSSAQAVIEQLSTIVHECGHAADIEAGGFTNSVYLITPNLTLECNGGDTIERGGGTFARSLLNRDEFALEACFSGANCDFYRDVYLDGDPENMNFEGGDQGYYSVVEETVQYINSLAVGYAFNTELRSRGSVSERDGISTFLWYITRYLRMARLEYPGAYSAIAEDSCWRQTILTLWGRAWFFLEASESMSHLGINDQNIQDRLTPELLDEIQRLRDLEGCGAN